MTHDMKMSLERLTAALGVARCAADELSADWAAVHGTRRDPGPVTDRSVIEAQAATIAELQATITRLCAESAPHPIRTVCAGCGAVLVDVPEDDRGVSHGACAIACWEARS